MQTVPFPAVIKPNSTGTFKFKLICREQNEKLKAVALLPKQISVLGVMQDGSVLACKEAGFELIWGMYTARHHLLQFRWQQLI